MAYRTKGNRHYPYNTGLFLGSEVDIVLTNENSEQLDAAEFLELTMVEETGGGEFQEQGNFVGHNHFKPLNGMVRMYSMMSYCRAYSTDNIWWMMKNILVQLNKRAKISFVPSFESEDGTIYNAAGHLKFSVKNMGIYEQDNNSELLAMTDREHESHVRLLDNIRLIVGVVSLLLDRRESAELRRKEYGPYSSKEFRFSGDNRTAYQTPTNVWMFSPILTHLMFGALRWAFFLTQNNFENEMWEGFEPEDVKQAIHTSDYETGMEIWSLIRGRVEDAGYHGEANPFGKQPNAILELLFDEGMAAIGDGVYRNWRLNRKMTRYQGHFHDLPSWESGAAKRIFTAEHRLHKKLQQYMET